MLKFQSVLCMCILWDIYIYDLVSLEGSKVRFLNQWPLWEQHTLVCPFRKQVGHSLYTTCKQVRWANKEENFTAQKKKIFFFCWNPREKKVNLKKLTCILWRVVWPLLDRWTNIAGWGGWWWRKSVLRVRRRCFGPSGARPSWPCSFSFLSFSLLDLRKALLTPRLLFKQK
jgi:hypothetical protein